MGSFSDLQSCGYSPGTAFLKHQPSAVFLTCSLPHANFLGLCLGFFFFLQPLLSSSSLVPTPEPHLLLSWKYNLVGCPMHSCGNAFVPFEIFPSGYFLSWVFKRKIQLLRVNKKKDSLLLLLGFPGNTISKRNGIPLKQKIKWGQECGNLLISNERIN